MTLNLNRFHSVPSFVREFDELFRDPQRGYPLALAADVKETPTGIELQLDVPGVKPEDIEIQVEGNVLTIKATRAESATVETDNWVRRERSVGAMARSFTLSSALDGTKPEATCKNGVLTVVLPKKQDVLPKTFKVKVEA